MLIVAIITVAVGAWALLSHREHYFLLSEVIPDARIVSQEDGIVEYHGVQYVLGTNELARKKYLIKTLKLLNLADSFNVDLRFNRQIIISISQHGPKFDRLGTEDLQ